MVGVIADMYVNNNMVKYMVFIFISPAQEKGLFFI